MRVLMSLPDRRVRGGPPSHLYLLRDSLSQLGVEMSGFVYGGRTHNERATRKLLGRLMDCVCFPFVVRQSRPDIIQLNSAFDVKGVLRDVLFVPTARALGKLVVIKFHGSDLKLLASRNPFWRLLIAIIIRGSNLVCLLSTEELRAFEARYPRSRFALVKNALDLSRYEGHFRFRQRFGIPTDKPALLFVARFIAEKGLREVILSLSLIRRSHDVHGIFVGDGPVRAENEALCRQLGLEKCVTFTGYIPEDETLGAYLESDVLVFPSYYQEGMPMVAFHALASGLPVVTTQNRAIADWLVDGRHCVFVPPRDPERLAGAVIDLLDHPEKRAELARAGKKLVRHLEKTQVAREFISLYESVLPCC